LNAEVCLTLPDHESLTVALEILIEIDEIKSCDVNFTIALDDFSEHPLMTENY